MSFEFGIEICRRLPAVALPFDVATFWKRCLSGLLGGSTSAAPNKSVETCTNDADAIHVRRSAKSHRSFLSEIADALGELAAQPDMGI